MIRYDIARAVYIKKLSEDKIHRLHELEISEGLKMAIALHPDNHENQPLNKIFTSKEIRDIFNLEILPEIKDKEYQDIKDSIDLVIPNYKDEETKDYHTDQEFTHKWDWAIFHKCPDFQVSQIEDKSNPSWMQK